MQIRVNDKKVFDVVDGSEFGNDYAPGMAILASGSEKLNRLCADFIFNHSGILCSSHMIKCDAYPYVLVAATKNLDKVKYLRMVCRAYALGINNHISFVLEPK